MTDTSHWFVRIEKREFTRLVKFPSGEMPTTVAENVSFGAGLESSGVAPAMLDELDVVTNLSKEGYIVYDPAMAQENPESPTGQDLPGIDEDAEEIPIRQFKYPDGLPIDGLPEDGGVVRIEDELIAYRELDTTGGYLLGCVRGILGTEPRYHAIPARIIPMTGIVVSKLESELTEQAAEVQVSDAKSFPRAGYLRIGDEIIGYTGRSDSSFTMPARRATDDESDPGSSSPSDTGGANASSGLFRGRFGTTPLAHENEAIVYAMPFRYWDRSARFADDAAMSYFEVKKHVPGGIWKRVAWTEFLVPHVDIHLLVRFDGGPNWDEDRKFVELGVDAMPTTDKKSYLYLITNPHEENRLDIRSDRIEVRVLFVYQPGAYQRSEEGDDFVMPNEWKDTPRLKALRIEYIAPKTVLYHEEIE
jgi:hypothetical protein